MKLEEAIENIKEYIAKLDDYIVHLYDENGSFKKQKETYITILQEIEHLQKENRELKKKIEYIEEDRHNSAEAYKDMLKEQQRYYEERMEKTY